MNYDLLHTPNHHILSIAMNVASRYKRQNCNQVMVNGSYVTKARKITLHSHKSKKSWFCSPAGRQRETEKSKVVWKENRQLGLLPLHWTQMRKCFRTTHKATNAKSGPGIHDLCACSSLQSEAKEKIAIHYGLKCMHLRMKLDSFVDMESILIYI